MQLRVSIVSYSNTLPFVYGLEHYMDTAVIDAFKIHKHYPSQCAASLLSGEADLALAPVAILADNPHLNICSDFCIGAIGAVDSVLLLSNCPIDQITTIMLDYQSRTSNLLTRVLARHHWHINPLFVVGEEGYEHNTTNHHAVVVIGDRAFEHRAEYAYQYDLAEEWQKMTGMPFVFAVWTSVHNISADTLTQFNQMMQFGIDHTSDAILQAGENQLFDLNDYLLRKISYQLDDAKRTALNKFLEYAKAL